MVNITWIPHGETGELIGVNDVSFERPDDRRITLQNLKYESMDALRVALERYAATHQTRREELKV